MKDILLYKGDCLIEMDKIADGSVDAIITDPPYKLIAGGVTGSLSKKITGSTLNHNSENTKNGNGNFKVNLIKFNEWLPSCFKCLKNGGHFYVMVNDRNVKEMLNEAELAGFKLLNILCWVKNNAMPNHLYMKNVEFVLFFRKGSAVYIKNQGTKQTLEFTNPKNKLHPSEKPVALMQTLISNSTNANDTVLDPFMGSGSTAIACLNTSRKFIGIEMDDAYFEIAKNRIENHIIPQ